MNAHRGFITAEQVVVGIGLCLIAPGAAAHDMGNVVIAYSLVLAIPVPALLALVGWKRGLLCFVPLCALALWCANAGDYKVMYTLLFLPYAVLLARTVLRRSQKGRPDA